MRCPWWRKGSIRHFTSAPSDTLRKQTARKHTQLLIRPDQGGISAYNRLLNIICQGHSVYEIRKVHRLWHVLVFLSFIFLSCKFKTLCWAYLFWNEQNDACVCACKCEGSPRPGESAQLGEGMPDSFQRTNRRHAPRAVLLPGSLADFPVQMVAQQSPERDI